MRHHSVRSLVVAAALALGAGCHDSTAPLPETGDVPGDYVLESTRGRGPAEGEFILFADGSAERRVRYAQVNTNEIVMIGSWRIEATEISFALREHPVQAYVWPVRGEWRGAGFTIHYPEPADGPDIVETYRRR